MFADNSRLEDSGHSMPKQCVIHDCAHTRSHPSRECLAISGELGVTLSRTVSPDVKWRSMCHRHGVSVVPR
jgi:hypothetical protein